MTAEQVPESSKIETEKLRRLVVKWDLGNEPDINFCMFVLVRRPRMESCFTQRRTKEDERYEGVLSFSLTALRCTELHFRAGLRAYKGR